MTKYDFYIKFFSKISGFYIAGWTYKFSLASIFFKDLWSSKSQIFILEKQCLSFLLIWIIPGFISLWTILFYDNNFLMINLGYDPLKGALLTISWNKIPLSLFYNNNKILYSNKTQKF